MILAVITGGAAFAAALPAAGTAAAALAPILPSATEAGVLAAAASIPRAYETARIAYDIASNGFNIVSVEDLARATEKVTKIGHYANGDWYVPHFA